MLTIFGHCDVDFCTVRAFCYSKRSYCKLIAERGNEMADDCCCTAENVCFILSIVQIQLKDVIFSDDSIVIFCTRWFPLYSNSGRVN